MNEFVLTLQTYDISCPRHGESKRTVPSIFSRTLPKCAECIREEEEEEERVRQASEARKRAELIRKRLESSGIPSRYMNLSWDDFDKNQGKDAESVYRMLRDYSQNFVPVLESGKCLLLCGCTGTGKTMLSCLVARDVIASGHTARYSTASRIFDEYKETFSKEGRKKSDVVNSYILPSLLVIDEVGLQYGSETEKLIISEIIGCRYDEMRPTIFISNFDASGVLGFLGERVMSRLCEAGGGEVAFSWGDFRKRR